MEAYQDKPKDTTQQQRAPDASSQDASDDMSGGFSKSGHYDMLRDVILRAEIMSDAQTKVPAA